MKLIDGKALLLKLRDPKRVTDMIPNCKEVNKQEILVNLGIDEAHTLRSLGSSHCTVERSVLMSRVQAKQPAQFGLRITL